MDNRQLLLVGGQVHALEGSQKHEAVLLSDGKVLQVGDEDSLRGLAARRAKIVDVDGGTILPGLIDTHPHLMHFGALEEPLVPLWDAVDHQDIVSRIARRSATTRSGQWIMATPVGEPHFFFRRSYRDLVEGELPTREVLDRASDRHPPVRPNVLAFNSAALSKLGIDHNTADQIGAIQIEKDSSGIPTGRLFGAVNNYYGYDAFGTAIWRSVPFLQVGALVPGTLRAIEKYLALGVTTIFENHMIDGDQAGTYQALRDADRLRMRVMVAQECAPVGLPGQHETPLAEVLSEARDFMTLDDPWYRHCGVSVIWDGLCSTGHALMREPYPGPDGAPTLGRLQVLPETIETIMRFCAEHRLRLSIIVGGLRAHDENLALLERLARVYDIASLNWLLVHSPFLEAAQIRRYRALNIDLTTTMMFAWGKGDVYRRNLGADALSRLLPLRDCLDAGMTVAAGTDWGPKNPFEQIELALTHTFGQSGYRNRGRAQEVSPTEALSMWTTGAARLLHWPEIGSLTPGTYGDVIVTDQDPLSVDIEKIGDTQVRLTILGGKVVHDPDRMVEW
ncbi:MAG: amidohydrolase family protein [Nocardiopsis sp. BM-2018]|nr:MAG: amidohydrolase family protein [Nocardiopsis sp. BM-2018]